MQALFLRLQLYQSQILCLFIADRHFSSDQGLSETGSRVELHLKHGLAVLVAVSWAGIQLGYH